MLHHGSVTSAPLPRPPRAPEGRPVPPARVPHRDWRLVGWVALGGAVGSALRYAAALALPTPGGWPLGTLAVNVVGAFLLGLLLEAVARRGPETRRLQRLRLTLGTGVLGGFTTYSSFALEVDQLLRDGAAALAVGYLGASLVLGTLAALAGVAAGARVPRSAAGRLLQAPDAAPGPASGTGGAP